MDTLVTPNRAAQVLGTSDRHVRQMLRAGELPGEKQGGRWLIRWNDLVTYLDAHRCHCASAA